MRGLNKSSVKGVPLFLCTLTLMTTNMLHQKSGLEMSGICLFVLYVTVLFDVTLGEYTKMSSQKNLDF